MCSQKRNSSSIFVFLSFYIIFRSTPPSRTFLSLLLTCIRLSALWCSRRYLIFRLGIVNHHYCLSWFSKISGKDKSFIIKCSTNFLDNKLEMLKIPDEESKILPSVLIFWKDVTYPPSQIKKLVFTQNLKSITNMKEEFQAIFANDCLT